MAESLPPPIYSQRDQDDGVPHRLIDNISEPQILIIPTMDTVNFQKGYLGAEGERAAIEGELQVKGVDPSQWIQV